MVPGAIQAVSRKVGTRPRFQVVGLLQAPPRPILRRRRGVVSTTVWVRQA